MKHLAASILFLLAAGAAVAGDNPDNAKGFQPGQLYQFGDVSHVSLYNGNLNLSLPVGQRFPVGGNLSYGFTLAYSGNSWEIASRTKEITNPDGSITEKDFFHLIPTQRANAGIGWYLSSGGQLSANGVDAALVTPPIWTYRTADAAEHNLGGTGIGMSEDTYMRLQAIACDDGSPCQDVAFPDGTIHRFKAAGGIPLVGIRDLFGNKVSVDIEPPPPVFGLPATPPVWHFTDSTGRVQTVTFERLQAPTLPNSGDEPKTFDVVKTVQLTAFGGATATYTFHYSPDAGGDHMSLIPRLPITGCACLDPEVNVEVYVPLLTSITLPDGSFYAMAYYPTTAITDPTFTGSIQSLVLPTLGQYEWQYQKYTFPGIHLSPPPPAGGFIDAPDTTSTSIGLKLEIKRDQSGNRIEQTQYDPTLNSAQTGTVDSATTAITTVQVFAPGSPNDTLLSRAVHYFGAGVGLPITLDSAALADPVLVTEGISTTDVSGGKTRHLSTKNYDAAGRLLTYSYLSYGVNTFVDSEKVFYRNPADGSLISSATDSSDFDGYGHYRTVTTTGSGFPGSNNTRTVTTAYNKADPATGGALFDTGTVGTNFQAISANSPWLINMYSSVTAAEGTSARKSLFSFNTTTGFLERTRVLADSGGAPAPAANDLITHFSPDTAGNVQLEEDFGGDVTTVDKDHPLADITLSGRAYAQYHLYSAGALSNTSYIDPLCASSPQTSCSPVLTVADNTIDAGTGLTAKSRDVSGLETLFTFDSSGRLATVTPPGVSQTAYTYTPATSGVPASVTAQTPIGSTPNGLKSVYTYDSLGRLVLEATIGTDKNRYRATAYDAIGRKASESSREATATPGHPTTYSYDALNRVISVTQPDGSTTSFDRSAEPAVTKQTVSIYTSAGDTLATTTESHDRQNRLFSLLDANGTTTTYTYDVAGHLTSVTMPGDNNTTQHRYFTYDGRGFLQSEQHPELGITGNGTSTYSNYDARGHVGRKLTGTAGGAYDLSFTYDLAERLTFAYDFGGNHVQTAFTFGDANGTGSPVDYRQGKLVTAARHNQVAAPVSADIVVTETYKYENTSGRPSERDTQVVNGSTAIQSFGQLFTYDALGAVAAPGYPTCLPPLTCSIPALTTATNVYTNGLLTGVTGFASLAYNDNGTLGTVTHQNSVTHVDNVIDTIQQDANSMPRPAMITFSGVAACTASATVGAGGSISPGGSFNIQIALSGTGPWSLTWSDNVTQSGITSSPAMRTVTPAVTTTYSLTSVSDATCTGTSSGSATVTVSGSTCTASATVGSGGTITQGASFNIQTVLAGTAPWSLIWSDGVTQSGIASSPVTRTVTPAVATTYSVTSVSDATCTGTSSGSATVTVSAPACTASATVGSGGTITQGASFTIQTVLTGTAPWSLTWSDGVTQSGITSSPVTRTVTPAATTTYSVTSVSDATCTGTSSGSATVTVTICVPAVITAQPTSNLATVTFGGGATLSIGVTGTAVSVEWYTTASVHVGTGAIITVFPNATTIYYATVANNCTTAIPSATVTVSVCFPATISAQPTTSAALINPGGSATLSIGVTGSAGSVEWYTSANVHIGSGTSITVFPAVTTIYYALVANSCTAAITSAPVTVSVCVPAAISVQPVSSPASIPPGGSATLSIGVTGTAPSIQWFTDADVSVGSGASITVSPAVTTTYYANVSNFCSAPLKSQLVTLTVCVPVSITSQSTSNPSTILPGGTSALSVGVAGTAPVNVQWFTASGTSVGSGLTTNVSPTITTTYYANATNACGMVDSSFVSVVICEPAGLGKDPTALPSTITAGQTSNLAISEATGSAPLTYLWYTSDGTLIGSLTNKTFNVSPSVTTSYYYKVSNSCSTIGPSTTGPSPTVTVTVCVPAAISSQPSSSPVSITLGGSATLSIGVTGAAPVNVQWFTSANVSVGSGTSITVSPTATTTYYATVSNSCSSVITSATVTVPVCVPASISLPPTSSPGTITPGNSATLSIGVTGTSPTIQWFTAAGVNVGSGASISVSPTSTTTYHATVSNSCTATITSPNVTVSVCFPAAISTPPASSPASITLGGSATLSIGVTGTTPVTVQWFTSANVSVGSGTTITVSPSATTTYYATVSGACGPSITSPTVTVPVCVPVAITGGTANPPTITIGGSSTLSIGVTGTSPTIQWFTSSGTNVGSGSSITVSPTSTTTYFATVSNSCSATITGPTVTVTVCFPAAISAQPTATPPTIDAGMSSTLSISVTGTAPVTVQWYAGTTLVGSGTSITVSPGIGSTAYHAVISNACATNVQSANCSVTVCSPGLGTTLTATPSTITTGQVSKLEVGGATGTGPLTYIWFTSDGTQIGTSTSKKLNVSPAVTTAYYYKVTNSCGTTGASPTVTVTVQSSSRPSRPVIRNPQNVGSEDRHD